MTPTAGETISAKLKWPPVRPYLGIGCGHNPVAKPGFSFAADIGVVFGKPSLSFNVPEDLAQQAGAANVAAAERRHGKPDEGPCRKVNAVQQVK